MAKPRVEMNSRGARAILNSPSVLAMLRAQVEAIEGRANATKPDGSDGYASYVREGKNRARGVVHTTDLASQRSNRKHNTLLKALR